MKQTDSESSCASHSHASSHPYRRLTSNEEISQCASWCRRHRAWKLHAHINELLTKGRISGDQGYSDDATPMLYVSSTNDSTSVPPSENFEFQVEVVLLFYGSGNIEAVLERARGNTHALEPQQSQLVDQQSQIDEDDTSFYVTFETTKSHDSIRQLAFMLRELLPIHESFYFSGISDTYDDMVSQLARDHRATLEWDREHEWCATAASRAKEVAASTTSDSSSSSQFTIDSLRIEHVDLVVCNWDYASNSTPSLIRHLIENGRTIAVYHQGKPVSYCLQQQYGSIGMLYTEREFRHQGLASKCVTAMCDKILQSDANQILSAHISDENASSERVFSKLGFSKISKIRWIFWIPPYDTSSCAKEVQLNSESDIIS